MLEHERVGEDHPRDPVAGEFGQACEHHSPGGGAAGDDVAQILVEQQTGQLRCVGLGRDARPQRMRAFPAAIERRCQHKMALRAQQGGDAAKNPATLIGAVDQQDGAHAWLP